MTKNRTQKRRARLTEIATVLASYGFGHIYRTRVGSKKEQQDAESLRLAFEELGPTFVKFGQILSTRPDLLPKDYIEEMSKLQDQVPPFPFDQIKEIFEEDLKIRLEDAFAWVDEEPLASASIAQVHRARTFDGEDVIIKVQRPDMEEDLLRDISLFKRLISLTPDLIKDFVVDAEVAIEEVERATRKELDFRKEVGAILRFRQNNEHRPVVSAPKPILEYTSKRVLVEEYVEGINGLNTKKLVKAGYDKEDFVEKFVYTFLTQVFDDGFFHADPHPGNVIIRDGQIVYIDFGLFGELSEQNRSKLIDFIEAIVFEDIDKLMNILLQITIVKTDIDRIDLYNDLEKFFYIYVAKDFNQIDMSQVFMDVLSVTRKHGLIMPTDFILLAKSLGILEGVVREFETDLNIMDIAKTYIKQREDLTLFNRLKSENLGLKAYQIATDTMELPKSIKKSLETISQGRTRINLEIIDWDEKSVDINKMVNRLVFAIIIASLILASAFITVNVTSPGLSRLSIIIFLGAGLMGLWLLISIIRSGTL